MELFSVENEEVMHYTIQEVAEETGLHHITIREQIKDHKIVTEKFRNRHWISQKDLDKLRSESPIARGRIGLVGIKAKREYQEVGVAHLEKGKTTLLACDIGLGKTTASKPAAEAIIPPDLL